MSIQTINIGNRVNDGLGDDLRTAFQKVNANFSDLNSALTVTASNVGTTGVGIFKQKVGADLEFKSLKGSNRIHVTESPDNNIITIEDSIDLAFTQITTNSGTARATTNSALTMQGTGNIIVSSSTVSGYERIIIDTALDVNNILQNYDFGPITGLYDNSVQFSIAGSNIDFGTIETPGSFELDAGSI